MTNDLLTALQRAYRDAVTVEEVNREIERTRQEERRVGEEKPMKITIEDRRGRRRKRYFTDLEVNESFHIEGCNTIYRKVRECNSNRHYMMEEVSGRFFPATGSPIIPVKVKVTVENL